MKLSSLVRLKAEEGRVARGGEAELQIARAINQRGRADTVHRKGNEVGQLRGFLHANGDRERAVGRVFREQP